MYKKENWDSREQGKKHEVKRNGVLEILKNYSYIIYGTINSIVPMYAPKACMYL